MLLCATGRPPASSVPPGRPATLVSSTRSRPFWPTGVPGGKPRANVASRSARVLGGATVPAIDEASEPSGELRWSPGPSASTWPPRARIFARCGATVRRVSDSPRARPGKTRLGSQSILSPSNGSTSCPRIVPKMRVRTVSRTRVPPPVSCAFAASSDVVVAVAPAILYARSNAASEILSREPEVRRPYIRG